MKLYRKELRSRFTEDIKQDFSVDQGSSNPFEINKENERNILNVFLKNISPAYFKNKNIARIQIAHKKVFEELLRKKLMCIPVGFDVINQCYVVWNPFLFLNRITSNKNISIYTRLDEHSSLGIKNYKKIFLSNDELLYAVNSEYISTFLSEIDTHFEDLQLPIKKSLKVGSNYKKTNIYEIFDVPQRQRGGKWNNGYCEHNEDWFLFANVNQAGEGYSNDDELNLYDYNNRFENDNFIWESISSAKQDWGSITKLRGSQPYIFVRRPKTLKNEWEYIGQGSCIGTRGEMPVEFTWSFFSNIVLESLSVVKEPPAKYQKNLNYDKLCSETLALFEDNPIAAYIMFKEWFKENDSNESQKIIKTKFLDLTS